MTSNLFSPIETKERIATWAGTNQNAVHVIMAPIFSEDPIASRVPEYLILITVCTKFVTVTNTLPCLACFLNVCYRYMGGGGGMNNGEVDPKVAAALFAAGKKKRSGTTSNA